MRDSCVTGRPAVSIAALPTLTAARVRTSMTRSRCDQTKLAEESRDPDPDRCQDSPGLSTERASSKPRSSSRPSGHRERIRGGAKVVNNLKVGPRQDTGSASLGDRPKSPALRVVRVGRRALCSPSARRRSPSCWKPGPLPRRGASRPEPLALPNAPPLAGMLEAAIRARLGESAFPSLDQTVRPESPGLHPRPS